MSDVESKDAICLHIGCGLVVAPGWQNIDASLSLRLVKIPVIGQISARRLALPPWSKAASYGDIVKGLKIPPESCDLIYAAHVLEHLSLADFQIAMANIYSYLKPGGTFRAVVPDLEQYIQSYWQQRQDEKVATQAAKNFMTASGLGWNRPRQTWYDRVREALANYRHQWMWDRPSLQAAFSEHGFKNPRFCTYGDWHDPRFAKVEYEDSFEYAIGVEGQK
ncbi:MAG: methyltransferase domain-containing protein [Jaaginema sp. PMC 1079.18]|nr:methyltransferase domain-containing protein [Jaaginema sp. PMC 1080.18]MEC4851149.1 methyltransferase domain-containing protein [Jaaginema sp. PMC 1079.18]MEC4866708.1 methyltransferase domain-containing protein [Jaaginema sp. PMC 1078.18]